MAGRKNSIERQQEGSEITTTVTGGLISSKVKYSPEDGTTEETWPDGTKVSPNSNVYLHSYLVRNKYRKSYKIQLGVIFPTIWCL